MTAPHNLTKTLGTKRQYDKGSRNNFESSIWRSQRTCGGVYSVSCQLHWARTSFYQIGSVVGQRL